MALTAHTVGGTTNFDTAMALYSASCDDITATTVCDASNDDDSIPTICGSDMLYPADAAFTTSWCSALQFDNVTMDMLGVHYIAVKALTLSKDPVKDGSGGPADYEGHTHIALIPQEVFDEADTNAATGWPMANGGDPDPARDCQQEDDGADEDSGTVLGVGIAFAMISY